jgi:hypothetical protein
LRRARHSAHSAQAHGQVRDEPTRPRSIGAGCTKSFERSGELVVFANDQPGGYGDNRGAVTLTAAPGGLAAGPANAVGDLAGKWRNILEIFHRTAGVPVIAAFALGVSGILLFMPQGRDLVRGVGEDGLGRVAIAFAIAILFFAIQAWSWSRIVIATAPAGGRAGSSNGRRGCWPSCLLPRPVSRSWSVSNGTRPSA